MKTPRQFLFERHRSAEPKLDAIREFVVAAARDDQTATTPATTPTPPFTLRDLLQSCRWHLAGLGAAWLVVLVLNLDRPTDATVNLPREEIPAPRQLLASLQAYRRQLFELLDRPPAEPAAAPPRRSQLRSPSEVV